MDSNLIQLAFNQSDENVIIADYIMQGQQLYIFKTYINGGGYGGGYGDGYGYGYGDGDGEGYGEGYGDGYGEGYGGGDGEGYGEGNRSMII